MQTTQYLSATASTIIVIGLCIFFLFCVIFFFKGPKYQGKRHALITPILVLALCFSLPATTKAAQSINIIASYFGNIAQGYSDYGFIYGFSSSVVGVGMSKPASYSKEVIDDVLDSYETEETTVSTDNEPNVIVVLLESFIDPSEVKFLETSEDPIPNFHHLEDTYSTGYLTVPVVGAGTANTEFEILTGMSLQYFGTGEYPYKTILKETDTESIATALSSIGYGTHVVHNNGGNFYSRANAFSVMGFDSFTSKELMNIQEYTPLGNWSTDHILVNETKKALDSTPDQSDFVYTITVQGHGSYPDYQVLDNPAINVSGADSEESNYQWEYYVNMIHEVDQFIADLCDMVDERDEDTMIIFFGDHLPTMNLTEDDMKSGDLFKTKYVTYNNFGLAKKDADLTSYQLLAEMTNQMGIHEGTMFNYTQEKMNDLDYLSGLELLQYDILYGDRYIYGDETPVFKKDIVMGIDDVTINRCWLSDDGEYLCILGDNYTPWSDVFVNDTYVKTQFISSRLLKVPTSAVELANGDVIQVKQMGSSDTVFRVSNTYTWESFDELETETELSTETEQPVAPEGDLVDEHSAENENPEATVQEEQPINLPAADSDSSNTSNEEALPQ